MSGWIALFTTVGTRISDDGCALSVLSIVQASPVANVEVRDGQIIRLPAWMLDRAACAGMRIGEPRVSLSALVALHDLLAEQGFRQPFPGDQAVIEERCDEAIANSADS